MRNFKLKQRRALVKSHTELARQLDEYLNYCEAVRGMSRQTMLGKRWVCKAVLTEIPINDVREITNQHVNNWIALQANRGCSGRTVNTRLTNLIAMLRYFQDMGIVMPGMKLRMISKVKEQPARRQFYSKEQIEKVLEHANEMDWLLIRICFDCGLRISELRNLRLANLDGAKITFVGKGSKARESYMREDTLRRLMSWIEHNGTTDYLWTKRGCTKPISVEQIRYHMRKPFYDAGFKDFYPHSLRHSFATDIQSQGASLLEMQLMLGHSNATTTQRYIHGLDGQLENIFEKYHGESKNKLMDGIPKPKDTTATRSGNVEMIAQALGLLKQAEWASGDF